MSSVGGKKELSPTLARRKSEEVAAWQVLASEKTLFSRQHSFQHRQHLLHAYRGDGRFDEVHHRSCTILLLLAQDAHLRGIVMKAMLFP